jgi:hypothetical protein
LARKNCGLFLVTKVRIAVMSSDATSARRNQTLFIGGLYWLSWNTGLLNGSITYARTADDVLSAAYDAYGRASAYW